MEFLNYKNKVIQIERIDYLMDWGKKGEKQ